MKYRGRKYRMDPACSALRLCGMALAAAGVCVGCTGRIANGIVPTATGILLILLSALLHSGRIAEKLIRQIRESGAEQDLRASVPACFTLYSACPGKRVLRYIASLNPEAADRIRKKKRG